MKIIHVAAWRDGLRPRAGAATFVALLASALLATSCVAQEAYDDAQVSAKHYQKKSLELERRNQELEDENRRLEAQLQASDAQITEAGYTDAIDERLRNLRSILSELGGEPGDVTKFAVDGGYVYRVKDSILFPLGSAEISSDGLRVLQEVAADIKSRPHGRVYVRGHTDDLPVARPETRQRFPHGNLQLSAARAIEVAAFLGNRGGVDHKRLVVMGFGPSEPVAPNTSDGNRQKNRRVEIFVADADLAAPQK